MYTIVKTDDQPYIQNYQKILKAYKGNLVLSWMNGCKIQSFGVEYLVCWVILVCTFAHNFHWLLPTKFVFLIHMFSFIKFLLDFQFLE